MEILTWLGGIPLAEAIFWRASFTTAVTCSGDSFLDSLVPSLCAPVLKNTSVVPSAAAIFDIFSGIGCVRPFSQYDAVFIETFISSANFFCVIPHALRAWRSLFAKASASARGIQLLVNED